MISNLLPHSLQVATSYTNSGMCKGSNSPSPGSKKVAGWVAGWVRSLRLTYAVYPTKGSKGSNFVKNLRICEEKAGKIHEGKERRIEPTIRTTCYTCYPRMLREAVLGSAK